MAYKPTIGLEINAELKTRTKMFYKQFNERTKEMVGDIVPAEITIYEDRSFTFKLKTPKLQRF